MTDQTKTCEHEELHFGSGGFYVFCCNPHCSATWTATDLKGQIDYTGGSRDKRLNAGTFHWQPRKT